MDIEGEVMFWGVLAVVTAIAVIAVLPSFLDFLAGGEVDKTTGIKKHFFWNGKDD